MNDEDDAQSRRRRQRMLKLLLLRHRDQSCDIDLLPANLQDSDPDQTRVGNASVVVLQPAPVVGQLHGFHDHADARNFFYVLSTKRMTGVDHG